MAGAHRIFSSSLSSGAASIVVVPFLVVFHCNKGLDSLTFDVCFMLLYLSLQTLRALGEEQLDKLQISKDDVSYPSNLPFASGTYSEVCLIYLSVSARVSTESEEQRSRLAATDVGLLACLTSVAVVFRFPMPTLQ